jgi:hypothetical protein
MLKCSKLRYLRRIIWCFGYLKLGTRLQGGESGGPISIFGFRILLHSRIATKDCSYMTSIMQIIPVGASSACDK